MFGAVIYTDGGAQINPGPAGSGVHGYIYEYIHPTKGTGNPKQTLTQLGYLTNEEFVLRCTGKNGKKKDLQKEIKVIPENVTKEFIDEAFRSDYPFEVTPIEYINAVQGFKDPTTNSRAELAASVLGIKAILREIRTNPALKELMTIEVISDSEYVVKGFTERADIWRKNNYRKSDGKEIAHVDLWKELLALDENAKALNCAIRFTWIKGHADFYGNEAADHLATMGINFSKSSCMQLGNDDHRIEVLPAQGYWKKDFEKPDFFYNTYVIFNCAWNNNTNDFFCCSASFPGKEIGTKMRFLGSTQSDAGFCIIHYDEQGHLDDSEINGITMIKQIMNKQSVLLEKMPVIATIQTDVVFSNEFQNDYRLLGEEGLMVSDDIKHDLLTANRPEKRLNVTNVIIPPYISFRVEDIKERLEMIRNKIESNDVNTMKITDITDIFYDETIKRKSNEEIKTRVLKDKFKVGYSREEVKVSFKTLAKEYQLTHTSIPEEDQTKVVLKLGQDLPDRNTLKRLESIIDKIQVVTIAQAPYVFVYGIYITTKKGWILSCGYYSNLRCVSPKEAEHSD